jgi:hypothetical protein
MTRLRAGVTMLLLALALGCQGPAAPPAPAARSDVAADADRAFQRREWVLAARLLREAIVHDPGNLTLHYRLAICASHLDLREEAIREFQWVLARAPAGSQEAETARQWLTAAGVLRAAPAASTEPPPDETTGDARLTGRVVWNEPGQAPVDPRRMQLFLVGLPDGPTKEQRYVLRTDEDGAYAFRRIVAGEYKLTNRTAGEPTWRLRVRLEPGREQVLDLTPVNSTRARDDFPERR